MLSGYYRYILALGSNKGDSKINLATARTMLKNAGLIIQESQELKTSPLKHPDYDTSDHADYLNQVLILDSQLHPHEFYVFLRSIEAEIGHDHSQKWCPREIDIDILNVGILDQQRWIPVKIEFKECDLRIPHLGFGSRKFLQDLCFEDLKIPRQYWEANQLET